MNDYIQIGYTKKAHGVGGELKVVIEEEFIDDFDAADVVFLKVKGHFTPFFTEAARSPMNPIIKFDEVNSKEAAMEIAHCELFLRGKDVAEKEAVVVLTIQMYEGFTMVDEEKGLIGTIEEVIEYPQQDMAFLTYKGKEVMIPLNDTIVIGINDDIKQLIVNLPEGLLNL